MGADNHRVSYVGSGAQTQLLMTARQALYWLSHGSVLRGFRMDQVSFCVKLLSLITVGCILLSLLLQPPPLCPYANPSSSSSSSSVFVTLYVAQASLELFNPA